METASNQVIQNDDKVIIENNDIETTENSQAENEQGVDLKSEVDQLKKFTAKNREENAKYRAKNRELKAKLAAFEKAQSDSDKKSLEEQGHYKALWEKERDAKAALAQENENARMELSAIKVVGKFKEVANKKGCVDFDAAYALANSKYNSMLEIDEQLNVDPESIENVVEKIMLGHPKLFKKDSMGISEGSPSKVSTAPKALSQMTKSEKMQALKDKLAAHGHK